MAAIQTILSRCSSIAVNRRKTVGVQITRNEIPRTSLTPTTQPWRFTLEMPPVLKWWESRQLVEALDAMDRYSPEIITFAGTCLQWMWRYQGTLSQTQLSNILVDSYVGNQLTLNVLPSFMDPNRVMFYPNDLIQIGNYPYPVTVVNTVLRGTTGNVTFTVNRPNIIANIGINNGITVGPNCQFRVFVPNMPTYRLRPGGSLIVNGQVINNAYLEFDDVFELYEWTGGAA
jgi:hypothetical protein